MPFNSHPDQPQYFILPIEFSCFFKSFDFLWLDLFFLIYYFSAIVTWFSFCNLCFILTFQLFLVFTLMYFDKYSKIDSSSLKASIYLWTLSSRLAVYDLLYFLFFFSMLHLSGNPSAVLSMLVDSIFLWFLA